VLAHARAPLASNPSGGVAIMLMGVMVPALGGVGEKP
jgi:hypothetical protein